MYKNTCFDMKTVLEATTLKCVFLTAVEMLPVFLREAPLLALLCASDRLRWWGGIDSTTPVSHSGKVPERRNQTCVWTVRVYNNLRSLFSCFGISAPRVL